MPDEMVIVPSNGDGFVELARTKTGRLFKKHILTQGTLRHPTTGAEITIDDAFVKTLSDNFRNGVCDIVQIPLANDANEHSEAPDRNIGEVIDVQVQDKKVYAVMDVRDDTHADRVGKTYLGASALMHLDYTDTASGKKVGPTLLHAAVTNRPYVTGLEPYEEIVAATADTSSGAVLLSAVDVLETPIPPPATAQDTTGHDTKETDMGQPQTPPAAKPSLEDLLTALKSDHQIDVTALQAQAGQADQAAALSANLVKALTDAGVVSLSQTDQGVSTDDMVGAVAELATTNVALSNRVQTLERAGAEHAVTDLITAGRVLPAQKAAMVELRLTNPAIFDQIVPAEPIVKLSNEQGVTPTNDAAHTSNVDAEIERLSTLHAGRSGK
jgi:hypothetical protein